MVSMHQAINSELWEILIPVVNNDDPTERQFHQIWDEKVKKLAGGMTVIEPISGSWRSPEGHEFNEQMTPVRIMCSRGQILEIAEYTKSYYGQLAVMIYRISDECMIV